MAKNRFQGDPAIFISNEGADLPFISGQIIPDAGLQNAVIISLFTSQYWPGNTLFNERESLQIGSEFENVASGAITISSLNRIRLEALKALQWMIQENLAETIDVDVKNLNANIITVNILIKPPGKTALQLSLVRNALNWQFQAVFPAYAQLES